MSNDARKPKNSPGSTGGQYDTKPGGKGQDLPSLAEATQTPTNTNQRDDSQTTNNTIINSNGTEFDANQWDAIVNLMDTDLREKLHNKLAPCSEQEFFSAYAKAHEETFGETWELDSEQPVW
ncbi:hypothetical protein [Bombiscardovia coagulans]|uniref:AcrIC5-like domain-containing protein n=1 Tax=Bombiscardovia coagulans TaxID=686666 RepID=A0A261ESK0_9BIFI|nr:hypothetical protein [Bombiscardovia coagulans]OZG49833.1 hypothetical protein BOCO_0350 [Bombiscardovia coagulans]